MGARTWFGLILVLLAGLLWYMSRRSAGSERDPHWLDRAEKIGSLTMAATGIGLLIFSPLFGADDDASETTSVEIDGDFVDSVLITGGHVESLVVNQGDSPEEQERKRLQREYTILAFADRAASALDGRLVLVDAALESDDYAERLDAIREQVAPGAADDLSDAYDTLLAESLVSDLRSMLADEPLPSLDPQFASTLVDGSAVSEASFLLLLDQLDEAEGAIDLLLADLDKLAEEETDCNAEAWFSYREQAVALSRRWLENRSSFAYYAAQQVMAAVDPSATQTVEPFTELLVLRPVGISSGSELGATLTEIDEVSEQLTKDLQDHLTTGRALNDSDLDCLASINDDLVVNDDDTWDQVVWKAISLRDLGRYQDAVAAFIRYGELFSPTDQTAAAYAETAVQFTERIAVGGSPTKAVYVFAVEPDSPSDGLVKESDIIVRINDRDIAGPPDFETAVATRDKSAPLVLVVLRLDGGRFVEQTVLLEPNDGFGLGIMPI
ncbi:MAG: PDZ domain-containing protein [Actinomycetota bacterium]